MKDEDKNSTEVFRDFSETDINDEINYENINRQMQINLLKDNFDLDYETGFFSDKFN